MVLSAALGQWHDDVDAGKVSPFRVSMVYFTVGTGLYFIMLTSTVFATKICCGAFGSHTILISVVYQIENDHQKYQKEAAVWIGCLTRLLTWTGILTLAMDFPDTKPFLYPFCIGYAAATIHNRSARKKGPENTA